MAALKVTAYSSRSSDTAQQHNGETEAVSALNQACLASQICLSALTVVRPWRSWSV